MKLSSPVKIDGKFGSADIVVRLNKTSISVLVPAEEGRGLEVVGTLPLNGAQINQHEFVNMIKNICVEEIPNKSIQFKLFGGHRVDGAITVKPSFIFNVLYQEKSQSEHPILSHGWKPISHQLRTMNDFLTGSDRTRDVTDFYFR